MNKIKSGLAPTHPGELLREVVLPALGIAKSQAAADLQISRNHLYAVLREAAPVSPDLAVKLGKFCGNGPEIWMNLQTRYDLWEANKRLGPVLGSIPQRQPIDAAKS